MLGIASPAFDQPPDILVSADARLIALRIPSGMLVETRSGGSAFTRDSWQQYWAAPAFAPMPPPNSGAGEAMCAETMCTLLPRPDATAALLLRGRATREICGASVLVSAEPIRLRCGTFIPWVDRFSVWRNGAHAIWLGPGGVRILSDRAVRGERPWVPPLPTPRARR
jgi:competence protein ComEC